MRVGIRVDASRHMGTGHLMRCLTLADSLAARGARVTFASRSLPAAQQDRVRAHGHAHLDLGEAPPAADPDAARAPAAQAADAHLTAARLGGGFDWLVVDHYALDTAWETAAAHLARRMLVLDDLADRPHHCDLLVDQSYRRAPEQRYAPWVSGPTRLLLGPRYALLRPAFGHARALLAARDPRRLLLNFGGHDQQRVTDRVLDLLDGLASARRALDLVEVVAGADADLLARLRARTGRLPCEVHGFTDDMAGMMARAGLAIGAGGSSTLERMCLGLPSIVLVTAANQREMVADLVADGLAAYGGEASAPDLPGLTEAVTRLAEDAAWRDDMGARCMALVDGAGADRVATEMEEMA